jgi:hypothetical protein
MQYPQGRTFPPSAHGFGLIFTVIAVLLYAIFPKQFWSFLLVYPTLWIMFSRTVIDTNLIRAGLIQKKYGFFPLFLSRKIYLENYDAAIIKHDRVKYRSIQSTGTFVINSVESEDSYNALHLKLKKSLETELVIKGTTKEITKFIEDNLKTAELRFFRGAIHKNQEFFLTKNKAE